MKVLSKIFLAAFLLVGIASVAEIQQADAKPDCPGSGQTCAYETDGTVYVKSIYS